MILIRTDSYILKRETRVASCLPLLAYPGRRHTRPLLTCQRTANTFFTKGIWRACRSIPMEVRPFLPPGIGRMLSSSWDLLFACFLLLVDLTPLIVPHLRRTEKLFSRFVDGASLFEPDIASPKISSFKHFRNG